MDFALDCSCARPPSVARLARALMFVGALLDVDECFHFGGAFHFPLGDGFSVSLAPESGGRFRVQSCRWSRPSITLWSLDGGDDHLAGVVLDLVSQVRYAMRTWKETARADAPTARRQPSPNDVGR